MLFSSLTFLYYFLPVVIIIYFIAPSKIKNSVLLISSIVFYGCGEPRYILLMGLSIVVNYILGLLIEKYSKTKLANLCLFVSVFFSLAILGYYKYADFFIINFNTVTGLSVPMLKTTLPIGISFYTFQIMSYTIDVYRGHAKAQKSIINLATYVVLFPQLIAGPIVRYGDVMSALENRSHGFARCRTGIRRFICGLAKKVLIANTLGELCNIFNISTEKTVLFYWIYAIAYTLQIYFDFSGYSDMAIGLGQLFGFDFKENFNYPFVSNSITEFWRRWHMSLSSWFRDYLYIPLGGSRVSKIRWLFNIVIVWLLTGLWHGAAWNFIVWGLLFALLLINEKLWLGKAIQSLPRFLSHIYVMFFIVISFVIFDAPNLSEGLLRVYSMFGIDKVPMMEVQSLYYLQSYGIVLIIAIIGCTPFPKLCIERIRKSFYGDMALNITEPIACVILLFVITGYLVDASFNPFLYFRF